MGLKRCPVAQVMLILVRLLSIHDIGPIDIQWPVNKHFSPYQVANVTIPPMLRDVV